MVSPRPAAPSIRPFRCTRTTNVTRSFQRAAVRPANIRHAAAKRLSVSAAIGHTEAESHLQLATARLPSDVDVPTFSEKLYQWAATLTTSSQNLPLALPLRVDRTGNGFEMSMLRMRDTRPVSVADITATVEPVDNVGDVLFVRLFEAEGSDLVTGQRSGDDIAFLQQLSQALIDVPAILNTMPRAIKLAVVQSRD